MPTTDRRRPVAPLAAPSLDEIERARTRIAGSVVRTPCIRVDVDAPAEIWLKLETLQPIGSFKLRGATNAMRALGPERLTRGVYTASAGNMAQGVAWSAREMGVPCTVVVPEHAPRAKTDAVERLGATVRRLPFDAWWQVLVDHGLDGMVGTFIHPVADPAVIAGNGTIGLEIAEDVPDADAVLVPYGGGGLSCGIAASLNTVAPRAAVYACEVETAAPLAASLAAGAPTPADYRPTFVDGIGSRTVLEPMWPMARALLRGSLVVSLDEIAEAIRTLVRRARVVAEGAGAAPVAAALRGVGDHRRIVCVVSGGNIDADKLATILRGERP
jgi:threonine dehydratase